MSRKRNMAVNGFAELSKNRENEENSRVVWMRGERRWNGSAADGVI